MSVGGMPAGGVDLAAPAGGRSARAVSPRALCSPCIVSSPLKGGLSLSALRGGVWGLAGELITPVFSTREPGQRPQSRAIPPHSLAKFARGELFGGRIWRNRAGLSLPGPNGSLVRNRVAKRAEPRHCGQLDPSTFDRGTSSRCLQHELGPTISIGPWST